MDARFAEVIESLYPKYEALMGMKPVIVETVPRDTPVGGVYLFSKHGEHLYAGRTKRRIRDRIWDHVDAADSDCTFAWRLARAATGRLATYRKEGSQKHLLTDPGFKAAYDRAKLDIREMQIHYVGEPDPLKQSLLEIYVAVVTKAKHNDFSTH
jgi:hypothetical protein